LNVRGNNVAFSLKSLLPARFRGDSPVVPVVRLAGMIGGGGPLRSGLTLEAVAGPLARAFGVKSAPAVALIVNSPGGAAAQSHLIYRRIRMLAAEKRKKVIVAVEDLAASGGYMIAAAADEIVVDPSSIVGSIGVVSAGFGFTGLIERIGVERRVHTAGKSKAMLDPFRPEREEDVARLRAIQEDVHAAFIGLVKERRMGKLADDPDLFTGAFWSGAKAVELGLADRVGDLRSVLRTAYGDKVRLKVIPMEKSMLRRRLGLGGNDRFAASLVDRTMAVIEEHLMWSRFGL
jgi:signal peptide peptidase SppA